MEDKIDKGIAIALIVAVGILSIIGGIAIGKYLAPPKTITVDREVEVVKYVTVTKEVIKYVKVKDTSTTTTTDTTTTTTPNGGTTTTTHQTTTTTQNESENTNTSRDSIAQSEQTKVVEKIVEKTVRADWRVTAKVGFDIKSLSLTNVAGALVYGGEVQKRIVGPISIGAWGLSSGQGGLSLSLEF